MTKLDGLARSASRRFYWSVARRVERLPPSVRERLLREARAGGAWGGRSAAAAAAIACVAALLLVLAFAGMRCAAVRGGASREAGRRVGEWRAAPEADSELPLASRMGPSSRSLPRVIHASRLLDAREARLVPSRRGGRGVSVVPGTGRRWSVRAGLLRGRGHLYALLDLDWNPDLQRFSVQTHEGERRRSPVRACRRSGAVRAGEVLRAGRADRSDGRSL